MPRKPKVLIAQTSRMKTPDTPFRRSGGSQLSARVEGNDWPVLLQTCHSDEAEVESAEDSAGLPSAVTSVVVTVVLSAAGEGFISIRSGERSAGTR